MRFGNLENDFMKNNVFENVLPHIVVFFSYYFSDINLFYGKPLAGESLYFTSVYWCQLKVT